MKGIGAKYSANTFLNIPHAPKEIRLQSGNNAKFKKT
jgi:hypothetical protein